MNELYNMIFKRKSFHVFNGNDDHLSGDEIAEIERHCSSLTPLVPEIRTIFRIVPIEETSCRHGEYCILIYSERKDNYLQNVGYMGEQLDLWLASKNIGTCWYGMGKTDETQFGGLDYVIMFIIERADEKSFRKDYTKAKRKDLDEIWLGGRYLEIASDVRYAPSACNTQPWRIECNGDELRVYRVVGKRGIMPVHMVPYFNSIDIGIMLLFLEICLDQQGYCFSRDLRVEEPVEKTEYLSAIYDVKRIK